MLEIAGVHAGYGRLRVLHDVTVRLPEGQVVGLLGANGAGKTTLLGTIMGLVRTGSGSIDFLGASLKGRETHEIVQRGITLVPQGRELFAQMTVRENLETAGLTVTSKAEASRRMEEQLSIFPRLRERVNQRASTMSGGEQQMLAIARALMLQPKVLLLDEPTMGLAPRVIGDLAKVIRALNEKGQTILLVEQNLALVLATTQRVYALRNGRIVFEGETAEIRENRDVLKMYLE